MSRAISLWRPQSGEWHSELMLHLLGLLSGLIQFRLRAVLSQISWFPLPWKSCSCFLVFSIELWTESLTPLGLTYFLIAPSSSKNCAAQFMTYGSMEWATLQKSKISICLDPIDSLLPQQAHCAYYAWDAWWASDRSPICVPCHKDLLAVCSWHSSYGAKREDQEYPWEAYNDEI